MPYARLHNDTVVSLPPRTGRAVLREKKVARYGARRGTLIGMFIAAILCAMAACLFVALRTPSDGSAARCIHAHAGFVDVRATCSEPVTVAEPGAQVVVYPGASLERVRDAVRVRRGKASFIADKRTDGTTLRVHVSHGVIEVTGTRFTVEQGENSGRVVLEEGTIIFHHDEGDDVTLSPGDVVVWPPEPREVAPAPVPQPSSQPALAAMPVPRKPTPSSTRPAERTVKPKKPVVAVAAIAEDDQEEDEVDTTRTVLTMEEILKRIAALRQQKRLRDAVTLLVSQSQRGDITPAQMARLSWEIGLFIQDTGDKASTCTHWRNHARKYPDDSAHIERVRQLIEACDAAL